MTKFNYEEQDIFGKYCLIPMYQDGTKHKFKYIGMFKSDTYMDVPICPIHKMTQHDKQINTLDDLETVVNVIHCGIDETKVIRVALKDIEIIDDNKSLTIDELKRGDVVWDSHFLEWVKINYICKPKEKDDCIISFFRIGEVKLYMIPFENGRFYKKVV